MRTSAISHFRLSVRQSGELLLVHSQTCNQELAFEVCVINGSNFDNMGLKKIMKGPFDIPIYNELEDRFYYVEFNKDFPIKAAVGFANFKVKVSKQRSLEFESEPLKEELLFYSKALNQRY